jgi:hypothetical protein
MVSHLGSTLLFQGLLVFSRWPFQRQLSPGWVAQSVTGRSPRSLGESESWAWRKARQRLPSLCPSFTHGSTWWPQLLMWPMEFLPWVAAGSGSALQLEGIVGPSFREPQGLAPEQDPAPAVYWHQHVYSQSHITAATWFHFLSTSLRDKDGWSYCWCVWRKDGCQRCTGVTIAAQWQSGTWKTWGKEEGEWGGLFRS